MSRTAHRRGQPLMLLAVVVLGWIGIRAAIWEAPYGSPPSLAGFADLGRGSQSGEADIVSDGADLAASSARQPTIPSVLDSPASRTGTEPGSVMANEPADFWRNSLPPPSVPLPPVQQPIEPRVSGGHNLLMAAGFSHVRLPSELSAMLLASRAAPGNSSSPSLTRSAFERGDVRKNRWSFDAWLLLRPDEASAVAAGQGSYGRSQAGAVARFKLAPGSAHRPLAYIRTSAALDGQREGETAIGLAARPLSRLPVSIAGEMRVNRSGGDTDLRPAAFAVTEFPTVELPMRFRGEAYAQAGYVGGDFATAFVDGQARVDRRVARLGEAELRAGAATWGGAQKDAGRLDVGPTASVAFRLGETNARVSADWRFRVAGDAAPGSGPAVSLVAGF